MGMGKGLVGKLLLWWVKNVESGVRHNWEVQGNVNTDETGLGKMIVD